ncbi:MAG: 2-oxo acid dehydrogenase subunit E2 [Planctomycetaceae bacterium]|nr:2-oxo acid dehydrogenase subunit E2 [Planctomycetaceae bacterium]
MANEIKLPSLGDGIESGEVLELFVKVGDTIQKDQSLLEIETDKATATVPSDSAGKIVEILVKEGDTVQVGQALFRVEAVGGSASAATPASSGRAANPAPVVPVAATPAPASPAPVASAPVSSAPASPAPVAAAPVVAVQPAAAPIPASAPLTATAAASHSAAQVLTTDGADIPASPTIRRFAREIGVNLAQVKGTGPGGRIQREDVLEIVKQGSRPPVGGLAKNAAPVPAGDSDSFGPITIEKMSRIRKTIANKMFESSSTVPRVTNFDDADVTDLEDFRLSSKDDYAAQGIKLTSMPFVIKAVAMALKHNPAINASIDMEQGVIVYKKYINIGIAVDTERGLVVPSLRGADQLSIPEIARQLQLIATNSRDNNFGVEDLRGSTFTISNLGAIGGTYSTPIINVPESAILLLGRTRKLPVVIGDQIKPRLMMPLSLSYDHRLIDGAMAARFLNDIIGYLKAPSRLLLAL